MNEGKLTRNIKSEIVDSLYRDIPASSIDAIKRRTRAGMGRCQGGLLHAKGSGDHKQRGKSFILSEKTKAKR